MAGGRGITIRVRRPPPGDEPATASSLTSLERAEASGSEQEQEQEEPTAEGEVQPQAEEDENEGDGEEGEEEEPEEDEDEEQADDSSRVRPARVRSKTKGRGGRGRGRKRGRGRPSRASASGDESGSDAEGTGVDDQGFKTLTVKGTTYRLVGDEVILETDPEGEKKIDSKGRLLGGRQYKGYNFTSEWRQDPERIYMLSIDAARSAGYRDSLYFFRKNPQIVKILLYQSEKDKLIQDGRLSGQLKGRNVTMVAARNVYKLHGARFVSGGRAVVDDYYEAAARASGAKEGRAVGGISAEDQERKRETDRDRDRARRRPDAYTHTSFDAQGEPVITIFGDAGHQPFIRAGTWVSRKTLLQRADVTEVNWMLEMARSVRGINSELADTRRDRMVAFRHYDSGATPAEESVDGDADLSEDPHAAEDRPPWEKEKPVEEDEPASKRQATEKERGRIRGPPVGVYEPNTHMPHFRSTTQSTWASMEKVSARPFYIQDPSKHPTRPVLGGDRMGSGAWGLASFATEMLPPTAPVVGITLPAGEDVQQGTPA